jgi:hypothetical protein
MAAVKSRGNKLTEARLVDLFRRHGMTGGDVIYRLEVNLILHLSAREW